MATRNLVGGIESEMVGVEDVAARLGRSVVAVSERSGGGAGILWPGGLVITANHVVATVAVGGSVGLEGAGERTRARLLARDAEHDLALLRPEAALAGLEEAVVRGANTLRVGELVLALGHPWGERGQASAGIVSRAPGSGAPSGVPLASVVAAEVRLAPGNSGGPLADSAGRVVGINVMIANGLAIAAPSEAALALAARAREPGVVEGRLGVAGVLVPVPPAEQDGLLLTEVATGGSADAAGLIPGDVLLGRHIGNATRLVPGALEGLVAGRTEVWRVWRGGRVIDVETVPAAVPAAA